MDQKYKIFLGVAVIILIGGGLVALFFSKDNLEQITTIDSSPITPAPPVQPVSSSPALTVSTTPTKPPATLLTKKNTMPTVQIKTNKGEITVELFAEDAPKTVENFISLVKKGFYDGVIFHRVISGFMIQGGDPTGTGSGGPGYRFADELNPETPSYQRGYVRGVLAMANAGPNTNGSQFFIMHKDYPLPHAYTIFGRVTKGMETVDAISAGAVDSADRPITEVVMAKVEVVE